MGGPVQHGPRKVAFHSPAGRLPTRLIPARRRRPAPCARRQQTMLLPSPLSGLVRRAPSVASEARSDSSTPAPVHLSWFSAPETIARCLSVDRGLVLSPSPGRELARVPPSLPPAPDLPARPYAATWANVGACAPPFPAGRAAPNGGSLPSSCRGPGWVGGFFRSPSRPPGSGVVRAPVRSWARPRFAAGVPRRRCCLPAFVPFLAAFARCRPRAGRALGRWGGWVGGCRCPPSLARSPGLPPLSPQRLSGRERQADRGRPKIGDAARRASGTRAGDSAQAAGAERQGRPGTRRRPGRGREPPTFAHVAASGAGVVVQLPAAAGPRRRPIWRGARPSVQDGCPEATEE